jgi:hypothetical protein
MRAPYGSHANMMGVGTPHAFAADPRLSRPDDPAMMQDMMYVAGPARPAQVAPRQGTKMIVFVAVAFVSMVIVLVTGLLVLAASD